MEIYRVSKSLVRISEVELIYTGRGCRVVMREELLSMNKDR